MTRPHLTLGDAPLTIDSLVEAAHGRPIINLSSEGLARMIAGRGVIERAIAAEQPIYGVTTGLGSRATERLSDEQIADFSEQAIRARAHAVGPIAPIVSVRAAMLVRLNTLLCGASGANPATAEHLAACLTAGLTPVVRADGSVGVADLLPNAGIALALIGDGEMTDRNGATGTAIEMMATHGITPPALGPRDGLALISHSGTIGSSAALALHAARQAYNALQSAAALSIEGFRANLSAFDHRPLAQKPLPGQLAATEDLRTKLSGSALFDTSQARRVQDPLSFRNVPQIHGALAAALDVAHRDTEIEINGVSDNPVALPETHEVMSSGLYFTAELCNAIDSVNRAFTHVAAAQLARTAKHLNSTISGLPDHLAANDSRSSGLTPLVKALEGTAGELFQAAQPGAIWPSVNANGIEDCISGAPVAVMSLNRIATLSLRMSAIEMTIACRAIDLRDPSPPLGPFVAVLRDAVFDRVAPLDQDRPLSNDIQRLCDDLAGGSIPIRQSS